MTLKVLLAASEVHPLAKTGGLADVAGSLSPALRSMGVDVRIAMPYYSSVETETEALAELEVPTGGGAERVRVLGASLRGVPVYLLDHPGSFHREKLYGEPDDLQRFSLLSRACLEMLEPLAWVPDVIHCNDWHTALIPVYLRALYPEYSGVRTLLTIHNLQYQGKFASKLFPELGLPEDARPLLERKKSLNMLMGGLLQADALNAVSQRYSQEICTREYGHGLEDILRQRQDDVHGIVNGIDIDNWNPRTDPHAAFNFGPEDAREGKAANKAALKDELGVAGGQDLPMLVMVSRLTDQKGLDILLPLLPEMAGRSHVVILGTGYEPYHEALEEMERQHPGLRAVLRYDEGLAHRMYAAADYFLMPSRFEPCGLSQLISLRYGTLPIVRRTGGLADTVIDLDESPETGYGFVFGRYESEALRDAVFRALELYCDPGRLGEVVERAMTLDFSWARSASRYIELYEALASG